MPCSREHVEAIRDIVNEYDRFIVGHVACKLIAAVNNALAACDETCVWDDDGNTSCGMTEMEVECSLVVPDPIIYCPHCRRKIAPLPAAPEGEKT